MIQCGDSTVNFTKVRGSQLATIQTVIKKRPKAKFSTGLSMEAQEAMQQVVEETKMEDVARRGKRGSVLFSDTVQIRRGSNTGRSKFYNLVKDSSSSSHSLRATQRLDGKDASRSPSTTPRRGSVSSVAVEQVEMANRPIRERRGSRVEELKKEDRISGDGVVTGGGGGGGATGGGGGGTRGRRASIPSILLSDKSPRPSLTPRES